MIGDYAYDEALHRLALGAGIASSYHDFYGNEHAAPPETKRRILKAMGFAVETVADLETALGTLESHAWRHALPPVLVQRDDRRHEGLRLCIPADAAHASMIWHLYLEDGSERNGVWHLADLPVSAEREIEGRLTQQRIAAIDQEIPWGYHELQVRYEHQYAPAARMRYICVPARCYVPAGMTEGEARAFGVAVQVYSLRDGDDWGVGDFSCLAKLATRLKEHGVGAVGVNPLHELAPGNPDASSPYSPSSRLTLNPIYLDLQAVPDLAESELARALCYHPELVVVRAEAREREIIDYGPVARAKRRVLEACFDSFADNHLAQGTPRAQHFREFLDEGGATLARLSTFNALAEFFAAQGIGSWREWPHEYQDLHASAVTAFAAEHTAEILLFSYIQWESERQLAQAQAACEGMELGLYCDLAVGVDGASADIWARPELFARGIGVGAPPDPMSAEGQGWGLVPFSPFALFEDAYREFSALVRANMRRAGALRIDHVMGLLRLYWIPDGLPASEGAYVLYRVEDLFGILALESHRAKCVVIGEDLGTLPGGFRELLQDANLLSYRLMRFERVDGGGFVAPDCYPRLALASVGTHDLPPLAGFWFGDDIAARDQIGWVHDRGHEEWERAQERERLLRTLIETGDLTPEAAEPFWGTPRDDQNIEELIRAAYRFVARTPSMIALIQIEDLLSLRASINIPGTTNQHPNWRRRLPCNVDDLTRDERSVQLLRMMREVRADAARSG